MIRLDSDVSALSESEQFVVARLIEVGDLFQRVYETSRHKDAARVRRAL